MRTYLKTTEVVQQADTSLNQRINNPTVGIIACENCGAMSTGRQRNVQLVDYKTSQQRNQTSREFNKSKTAYLGFLGDQEKKLILIQNLFIFCIFLNEQ